MTRAVVGFPLRPSHSASIEHPPLMVPSGAATEQVAPARVTRIVSPTRAVTLPPDEVNVTGAYVGRLPVNGRTLSGVVPPGTYNVSVRAVNGCGNSGYTAVQSVTVF